MHSHSLQSVAIHTHGSMVGHHRETTSYSYFNFYLIVHNLGANPSYVDELSISEYFCVIHILMVAWIQSETYGYLLCWYLYLFCLPVPFKHAFMGCLQRQFQTFYDLKMKNGNMGTIPVPTAVYLGKLPRLLEFSYAYSTHLGESGWKPLVNNIPAYQLLLLLLSPMNVMLSERIQKWV